MPAAQYRDLAGRPTGPAAIPEPLDPIRFVPDLRSSPIVDACRAIAQEVIARPVTLVFDHAIRKAPHNGEPTPWHQDAAYDPKKNDAWPNTVTVWAALQDVGVGDGCTCFVPGSHRGGVVAHEVRGSGSRGDLLRAGVAPDTPEVVSPLPAGGVTLHRRTTLHRTGPNEGETARLAWGEDLADRALRGAASLLADGALPPEARLGAGARSFVLAAYRLHGAPPSDASTSSLAARYAETMTEVTDPSSTGAWPAIADRTQAVHEAGFVAIALWESRRQVWDQLDSVRQTRVIDWLAPARTATAWGNSWLLSGLLVELFLRRVGAGRDDALVERTLSALAA